MLHGPLLAAVIVAAWVFLACVVAPFVGRFLSRRQPADHCKHTKTPGSH